MRAWLNGHRFAITETAGHVARQPLSVFLNALAVGITLALPLLGYTVLNDLGPVSGQLAASPEMTVFMSLDSKRAESQALGPRLLALPGVATARFVPRDEALEDLKNRPGMREVLSVLGDNPLPDAWILHLASARGDPGEAQGQESLAAQVAALPKVEHVQVDSVWVQRLEALVRFVKLGLLIGAIALGAAVVAATFNTIRMQVLTQREEIEVARLIGATRAFIRRPFYYLGTVQGLLGGAIAAILVFAALIPLNGAVSEFARLYGSSFQFQPLAMQDIALFVAAAAVLGWFGAVLSVGRHLAATRNQA